MRDPSSDPELREAAGAAAFRAAMHRSGVALFVFALAAVCVLWRHRRALESANTWAMAAIPFGIVAVCFAHAYVVAFLGARRGDVIVRSILVAVLIGGVYWLTRYLDGRGS